MRQRAAATLLREMPGHAVAERLASRVTAMHGQGQLLALEILAGRGDPVAAPAVTMICSNVDFPEPFDPEITIGCSSPKE